MQKIILLRGVAPKGQNRIPSMSALANMLEEIGFEDVKTYIQSGNIVLTSDLSDEEIHTKVYDCIYNNIGADLAVIVKDVKQLNAAIADFGDELFAAGRQCLYLPETAAKKDYIPISQKGNLG